MKTKMMGLILVISGAMSLPVLAMDAGCENKAFAVLTEFLNSFSFDPQFAQLGKVNLVRPAEKADFADVQDVVNGGGVATYTGFVNTTEGSEFQAYEGQYYLDYDYQNQPYTLFKSQILKVVFSSPFICDSPKVACIEIYAERFANDYTQKDVTLTSPLPCSAN